MSTDSSHETSTTATAPAFAHGGRVHLLGLLTLIAGVVLAVAGVVTYVMVTQTLGDEKITVSDDANCAAGDDVNGPISAFCQADIINHHAMEASGGKTYAELAQDDPKRQTVMTASFLRASLFTSVVSFGVAAMAVGLGIVFCLIGWALMSIGSGMRGSAQPSAP